MDLRVARRSNLRLRCSRWLYKTSRTGIMATKHSRRERQCQTTLSSTRGPATDHHRPSALSGGYSDAVILARAPYVGRRETFTYHHSQHCDWPAPRPPRWAPTPTRTRCILSRSRPSHTPESAGEGRVGLLAMQSQTFQSSESLQSRRPTVGRIDGRVSNSGRGTL